MIYLIWKIKNKGIKERSRVISAKTKYLENLKKFMKYEKYKT
jgi:hypothetical protein